MRHAKQLQRGSKIKAPIFFTVLILFMAFSLVLPLRPTYSPAEKRQLAKFPEFTTEHLLSGKFFHGIDSWFSDTFPARDICFQMNNWIRTLYGFKTGAEIHGTVHAGDDIPDKPFTGN